MGDSPKKKTIRFDFIQFGAAYQLTFLARFGRPRYYEHGPSVRLSVTLVILA